MRAAWIVAGLLLLAALAVAYGATGNGDQVDPSTDPNGDGTDIPDAPGQETTMDTITTTASATLHAITGTSAAGMSISPNGVEAIKQSEGCRLTRYRLGDGGWTIGYGRYFPDGGPACPEQITLDQAEQWLREDIANVGEKKVRAYVTADLTQPQYDALCSMAYNLSVKGFRTIADAVNAGEDPDAAAMRLTRPGTDLEKGLRRRRGAELAMYHADPTTYG